MDQKVTNQNVLAELDDRGITFLTLRMRSTALNRHIAAAARHRVAHRAPGPRRQVPTTPASSTKPPPCRTTPHPVRQLIVTGLGRDAATVIITNDRTSTAKQLIERYARRMNIEQRLAESIRSFHTDALAGSVPLNVDLDVALTVLAGAVCAALRRRLTGYHHATPDTLQRRFLSTTGTIHNTGDTITVHLDRRTYSPDPAASRHPRHHHPLVEQPHPALRIRLTPPGRSDRGPNRCAKIGANAGPASVISTFLLRCVREPEAREDLITMHCCPGQSHVVPSSPAVGRFRSTSSAACRLHQNHSATGDPTGPLHGKGIIYRSRPKPPNTTPQPPGQPTWANCAAGGGTGHPLGDSPAAPRDLAPANLASRVGWPGHR